MQKYLLNLKNFILFIIISSCVAGGVVLMSFAMYEISGYLQYYFSSDLFGYRSKKPDLDYFLTEYLIDKKQLSQLYYDYANYYKRDYKEFFNPDSTTGMKEASKIYKHLTLYTIGAGALCFLGAGIAAACYIGGVKI